MSMRSKMAVVASGIFVSISHSATLTVDPAGSASFTTIQAAVSVAVDGDLVLIRPGTYSESISIGGKLITLRGDGVANAVVLQSPTGGTMLRLENGETSALRFENLTFTGGTSAPVVEILNSDPVFERCIFRNNTFHALRDVRTCASTGGSTFRFCLFLENSQSNGGAMYLLHSNIVIEDCAFVANAATGPTSGVNAGGAVYVNDWTCGVHTFAFTRCVFANNSAVWGGAIYSQGVYPNATTQMPITDCVFVGNTASQGAAMWNWYITVPVSGSWFCGSTDQIRHSWTDSGNNQFFATCGTLPYADCDGDRIPDSLEITLGLAVDTDGDGSPDCSDGCPNDPLKVAAGTCGCGVADADSDGDGTPNCNDACPNDATKIAQSTYYLDGDTDGYGLASSTQSACSPPTGYVANNTDCNDSNAAVNPGATEVCNGIDDNCAGGIDNGLTFSNYYSDSDGDGAGDPAVVQNACAQPTGYVSNNTDGCPTNAGKQAPGVCGCATLDTDANSSGTPDCADVTLAMTPLSTHIGPTGTLTVRVSMGASAIYSISGAGLSVAFDATKLQFVSATPVAGGPFSAGSVVSSDNAAGALRYTLSLGSSQTATQSAANLVDIAFSPVSGAEACGPAGLVSFGTVSSVGTSLSYSGGGSQSPVVSNLGAIYLDQTAPVITNAFADTALAADAGTIAGAAVTAPSVTAFDTCANESRPVSLSIALAGGGTVTSWPVRFPVGVSTITWSSTDQAGNTATDVHTVTVANHQLLDLSVAFSGVMQGTSTRQIRVTVGGQASLHTVNLTGNSGSVLGVQVPVAASYPCMAIKCPTHSLTDAVSPTVSGSRYAAVVALPQGDNNDDDMVEIFDYAIFVSVRGPGRATNAVANYNADTLIGNADFTYIALNFFRAAETCTPSADAPQPRDRISVKDLRRAGYGNLAVADLNRDGWVDLRDMQMYMQGAGMQGTLGEGQIESRTGGTSNGW
jgi:predicted outer membrane repeat protein